MNSSPYLWRPEEHPWTRDSHIARFMRTRGVSSLAELRQASVHCHQWFWDEVLRDMGIEWTHRYTQLRDMSRGFPWTRWFAGGEINVTHNCVERHVRDGHGAETALFCTGDDATGEPRRVSFAELAELVDRCALALRASGVQRGDSVAHVAPMQLPKVVVLFATMKLGARFVPIPPGCGPDALQERLEQSEAKVVFVGERVAQSGGSVDVEAAVRTAAAAVPTVLRIVKTDTTEWEEFLQSGGCVVPQRDPFATRWKPALPGEATHAEEPCLILPVDGAMREAKGTVHTHAGCLAQAGKDLRYAFDVRPGEPFFWVTEANESASVWAIIGCLLYRTPLVLFEGAAGVPSRDQLWGICSRLGVVTLGCSPTIVRRLMSGAEGLGPGRHDLSRLRVLGIDGEVQDEAAFRWYFDQVGGGRCPVVNVAGRAEIFGCHLQPYPIEPLKACSFGGPALGMDIDVYSEEGKSAPRGTVGHLVCKQPAPAMTKSFLGDDDRYLETYFKRFPGTWACGNRAKVDEDGQWFLVSGEERRSVEAPQESARAAQPA